jgi:hypothetical protein
LRELDRHAFSLQTAQLTRTRHYSDDFTVPSRHPRNAPDWTFVDQDTPADTDFSAPATEAESQDDDIVEE